MAIFDFIGVKKKSTSTLKIALILQNWKWSKIKMNSSHAFRTFRQSFSGRGTSQLPNTPISQIICRSLSSSQVSTALRPFYFLVHPDLFGRWPQEQAVNEASLKQLKSHLKSVFTSFYVVFYQNLIFRTKGMPDLKSLGWPDEGILQFLARPTKFGPDLENIIWKKTFFYGCPHLVTIRISNLASPFEAFTTNDKIS